MPKISELVALGWGNPGREGSSAAAAFRKHHIRTIKVQGTALPINANPDVQYVFTVLVRFLNANGAKLGKMRDDWGYANRDVRGYPGYKSYHSWGLAIDLDATENGLGSSRTTFNVAKTRRMCRALGIRWGHDYQGRKDPMHFEIMPGTTPKQLAARVRGLKRRGVLKRLAASVGIVGAAAAIATQGLTPAEPKPKPKPAATATTKAPTKAPTPTPSKVTPTKTATTTTTTSSTAPAPPTTSTTTPPAPSSSPVVPTPTATPTVTPTVTPTPTPTPSKTVAPKPEPKVETVTVKAGDTLGLIARREGTTIAAIVKLNPAITNPDRIYPGQKIRVK